MKYIKSSGGYYYKELSNGKRSRVSAEEYNTKKQKFLSKQGGGAGYGEQGYEGNRSESAYIDREQQKRKHHNKHHNRYNHNNNHHHQNQNEKIPHDLPHDQYD